MTKVKNLTLLLLATLTVGFGCGQKLETDTRDSVSNPQNEPPYQGKNVVAVAAADGFSVVSLSAQANFQRFRLVQKTYTSSSSSTTYYGLDHTIVDTYPVPVAEFQVFDSSGNRVQSGETTDSGGITFNILNRPGTYTLKVYSRSLNDDLKLSVLNNLTQKTPYSASMTFTLPKTNGANLGTVTATSDQTNLLGGAFNIHYAIFRAVKLLKTTSDFSTSSPSKVTAYWAQGFNPYSYFDRSASSPLSFYIPDTNELFISGGQSGAYLYTDTDQFDDSVIIHEYAHFLEDEYALSSSPGGFHDGDAIIDPRLAWSEGWANFFQGAVRKNMPLTAELSDSFSRYIDTEGILKSSDINKDSMAMIQRKLDLSAAALPTGSTQDKPLKANEGTFREFSIARTLYKGLNTSISYFTDYWAAFTDLRDTASDNSRIFSSFTKFYSGLSAGTITALSSHVTDEQQDITFAQYAVPTAVETTVNSTTISNCSISITPTAAIEKFGESFSNQMDSNDFLLYTHDSANTSMNLHFASGASNDLDLFIYDGAYDYMENPKGSFGSGVARASRVSGTSNEQVTLSGLVVGRKYLVNIRANSASATLSYYLSMNNGTRLLCKD